MKPLCFYDVSPLPEGRGLLEDDKNEVKYAEFKGNENVKVNITVYDYVSPDGWVGGNGETYNKLYLPAKRVLP